MMLESPHKRDLPAGTHALGMGLFLATLTMLFGAGLLAYLFIRLRAASDPAGLPMHSITVPWLLFLSTALMLAASACIHRALTAARIGRLHVTRSLLAVAAGLAVLFVAVQIPALWALWREHHAASQGFGVETETQIVPKQGIHAFYGAVVFLIATHAAHVFGGLIPLGVVLVKARQGCYTQAAHVPLRMLVWYWHFLDIVWVTLLLVFLVIG